jgi:oligosaccharide repeat unit polymerase
MLDLGISGNITYMYYDIEAIFPFALLLVGIANFTFYLGYIFTLNRKIKLTTTTRFFTYIERSNLTIASLLIFGLGLLGLILFIKSVGGFLPFILAGYGITEQLSKNPLLATSLPVLFVSVFLMISAAHQKKSKKLLLVAIVIFTLLILLNILMGRRAEVAVWCIAITIYYSVLYKPIPFKIIAPLILLGFIFLNFIGLVRTSNLADIDSIVSRVDEKANVVATENSGLFYTLLNGQFAVPFETLPVLMEKNNSEPLYLGTTVLMNVSLWIPRFIWQNKPYGFTNWYYKKFYDPSAPPNEGRAFFFLAEGYLNFGIIGVLFWAFIAGIFWKFIANLMTTSIGQRTSYTLAFIASIYTANMLKLIAADSGAIMVVIIKQTILIFIIGLILSKFLGLLLPHTANIKRRKY